MKNLELTNQALSYLQNLDDIEDAQTFFNLFLKSLSNSGVLSADLLQLFNEVEEIDKRMCFSIEIFGLLDEQTQFSLENELCEGESLKNYLEGKWLDTCFGKTTNFEFKGLKIFVSKEDEDSEGVKFSMSDNQKTEKFN